MSRTFVAEQCLEIARRILRQRDIGWPVDPVRIEWAEDVLRANPQPQDAPTRVLTEEDSHA